MPTRLQTLKATFSSIGGLLLLVTHSCVLPMDVTVADDKCRINERNGVQVGQAVDNTGSHSHLRDVREKVTIIPLLSNVTCVHQPIDMSVISTWKQI